MNKVETKIFHLAIDLLAKSGYALTAVDDGGESLEPVKDKVEALAAADSVEECTLIFKNAAGERAGVWFIWGNGNDGLDCLSDCTSNVEALLEPVDLWVNFVSSTTAAKLMNDGYDLEELERDNPYNQW